MPCIRRYYVRSEIGLLLCIVSYTDTGVLGGEQHHVLNVKVFPVALRLKIKTQEYLSFVVGRCPPPHFILAIIPNSSPESGEKTRMKRAADHQLTKEDIDVDGETIIACSSDTKSTDIELSTYTAPSVSTQAVAIEGSNVLSGLPVLPTSSLGTTPVGGSFGFGAYANINPFAAATASGGGLFTHTAERTVPAPDLASGTPAVSAGVGSFGFGAYAKTNPFVANTTVSSFTTAPAISAGIGSGSSLLFGSNKIISSSSNATTVTDDSNGETSNAPTNKISGPSKKLVIEATSFSLPDPAEGEGERSSFSSYTAKAPFAVTIPSPLTLSPKTQNPFSNPSPKHNPFVSIVESKDNLWSSASRSSSGTAASTGKSADSYRSNFPFPSSKAEENVKNSMIDNEVQSKTLEESKSVFVRPDTVKSDFTVSNNNDKIGFNGLASEAAVEANAHQMLSCIETDDKYVHEPQKRVFGAAPIIGVGRNEVSESKDDDNPVGDDEYTEEQVYGKVYPMPDNVTVVTGEENEVCVIQVRAKLFRLSVPNEQMIAAPKSEHIDDHLLAISKPIIPKSTAAILLSDESEKGGVVGEDKKEASHISLSNKKQSVGEWIEVGIGPVRILKKREILKSPKGSDLMQQKVDSTSDSSSGGRSTKTSAVATRLVMRREDKKGGKGTKLLLNTFLKGYINLKKQGERMFHITCISGTDEPSNPHNLNQTVGLSTFMLQTKQPQEADRLFDAINELVSQDRIHAS